MTTEQMVRKCFERWLYKNDTKEILLLIARASRRFVKMEEKQKIDDDWEVFRQACYGDHQKHCNGRKFKGTK